MKTPTTFPRLASVFAALFVPLTAFAAERIYPELRATYDSDVFTEGVSRGPVVTEGAFTACSTDSEYYQSTNRKTVKVFDSATGVVRFVLYPPFSSAEPHEFGTRLAISGTLLAVGDNSYRGLAVYVYDLAGANPTVPIATLPAQSGRPIAISGSRVLIGGSRCFVYDVASATPSVPTLTLDLPEPGLMSFGNHVAISGSRAIISGTTFAETDRVFAYDFAGPQPTVPTVLQNGPNRVLGGVSSLALEGTKAAVGNLYNSTVGAVNVYDLASATPTTVEWNATDPSIGNSLAVGLSGNRILISGSNAASVYDLTGATVSASVQFEGIFESCAISGKRLVVVNGSAVQELDFDGNIIPAHLGDINIYILRNLSQPILQSTWVPKTALDADYGAVCAIVGSTSVVGAPGDDRFGTDSGRAFVYTNGVCTPLSKPSPRAGERFGNAVAAAGLKVVVAASHEGTGAANAGSVYVFHSESLGMPPVTLHNPTPNVDDFFGCSVAVSSSHIVVGARGDDADGLNAGIAYVYDLNGRPVATLRNPAAKAGDLFGSAVAIDGRKIVVGAPTENGVGSALVFDLDQITPNVLVATFRSTSGGGGKFGRAVGIAGTRVAVGAAFESFGTAGRVYVYDTAAPSAAARILENPSASPLGGLFGFSLGMSGSRMIVGSPGHSEAGLPDAGMSYLYDLSSDAPTAQRVEPPGFSAQAGFGKAVAIDGTDFMETSVRRRQVRVYGQDSVPPNPTYLSLHIPATDRSGAVVTFPPAVDPDVTVVYDPPSGTRFPIGLNYVSQTATDPAGNTTVSDVYVYVFDFIPPTISGPFANLHLADGAPMPDYRALAVVDDLVDVGPEPIQQYPEPGTPKPAGNVQVIFYKYDAAGNYGFLNFIITPTADRTTTVATVGSAVAVAGVPDGAVWTKLGSPTVGYAGVVAFVGDWLAPDLQTGSGLFLLSGGATTLVARIGGDVGVFAGAKWAAFGTPSIVAEYISFTATISGGGITTANDDLIAMVETFTRTHSVLVREGDEIGGTGGARVRSFRSVQPFYDEDDTNLGISADVLLERGSGSPAISAASERAVLSAPYIHYTSNTRYPYATVHAGGQDGARFFSFLQSTPGSPGQARDGSLLTFTDGRQVAGWGIETGLSLNNPAIPGAVWAKIGIPSNGYLRGAYKVGAARPVAGIFNGTEPVILKGQSAPGISRAAFASFREPLGAHGAYGNIGVAFQATVVGKTVIDGNDQGIWWRPPNAPLKLIAREGAKVPGATANVRWKSFESLVNTPRGPIFIAKLRGAVTSKNDRAIYAVGLDETLREVLREGGIIGGKKVRTFTTLGATPGTTGVTRQFSPLGEVVLNVTFTDGTQSIVNIATP